MQNGVAAGLNGSSCERERSFGKGTTNCFQGFAGCPSEAIAANRRREECGRLHLRGQSRLRDLSWSCSRHPWNDLYHHQQSRYRYGQPWKKSSRDSTSSDPPKNTLRLAYSRLCLRSNPSVGWHFPRADIDDLWGRASSEEPNLYDRFGTKALRVSAVVSFREGLDRTIRQWKAKDEGQAQVHCNVEFFTTGYTPQPYSLIERGRSWKRNRFTRWSR